MDREIPGLPLNDGARVVGRVIVDDNDFPLPSGLDAQRANRGQRLVEPRGAIVGGDEQRDNHVTSSSISICCPLGASGEVEWSSPLINRTARSVAWPGSKNRLRATR